MNISKVFNLIFFCSFSRSTKLRPSSPLIYVESWSTARYSISVWPQVRLGYGRNKKVFQVHYWKLWRLYLVIVSCNSRLRLCISQLYLLKVETNSFFPTYRLFFARTKTYENRTSHLTGKRRNCSKSGCQCSWCARSKHFISVFGFVEIFFYLRASWTRPVWTSYI
jgi:hypothetical protein